MPQFKTLVISAILIVFALLFTCWFVFLRGTGGLTRMVSITGIYAVCKPKDYDVVCFADRGTDGFYCMKLSDASRTGECK